MWSNRNSWSLQGFLTQDLLQDLATVIVCVLEKVLRWNTDAFPPTGQPVRPSLNLQVTSSNKKDENCVAGRGACVLLGIQRKGSSDCLVLRALEGAGLCRFAPRLVLRCTGLSQWCWRTSLPGLVLILNQIKLNSQLSRCAFLFSRQRQLHIFCDYFCLRFI